MGKWVGSAMAMATPIGTVEREHFDRGTASSNPTKLFLYLLVSTAWTSMQRVFEPTDHGGGE